MKLNPPGVGTRFSGGWNNPGTIIVMPLSPDCMLYTQAGVRRPMQYECLTVEQARSLNRLTAQHASRTIYAQHPPAHIESFRSREVNAFRYEQEKEALRTFHDAQITAEWEMLTHPINDFPERT